MTANLYQLIAESTDYANNYPGTLDDTTRYAIFVSHLAYLLRRTS